MKTCRVLVCITFLVLGMASSDIAFASSQYHSDPPASIVFTKDLKGYGNYGQKDRGADILYPGESNMWIFDLSAVSIPIQQGELGISLVCDDHYDVPIDQYQGTIKIDETVLHSGNFSSLSVKHGQPYGQQFDNWKMIRFQIKNLGSTVRIEISNDSNLDRSHWIAIDVIQIWVHEPQVE